MNTPPNLVRLRAILCSAVELIVTLMHPEKRMVRIIARRPLRRPAKAGQRPGGLQFLK